MYHEVSGKNEDRSQIQYSEISLSKDAGCDLSLICTEWSSFHISDGRHILKSQIGSLNPATATQAVWHVQVLVDLDLTP